MSVFLKVLLVILVILVAALVVLYFLGRRLQKKQNAAQEQMEATKQTVTMLVIDKKMMRMKDAGLPQIVIDQTPKLMRRNKLPIVKAKIGPKITTLVADSKIYDIIPIKKEVKATISGIYIMDVRAVRGQLEIPEKKKNWRARLTDRVKGVFTGSKADAAPSDKASSGKSSSKKSSSGKK